MLGVAALTPHRTARSHTMSFDLSRCYGYLLLCLPTHPAFNNSSENYCPPPSMGHRSGFLGWIHTRVTSNMSHHLKKKIGSASFGSVGYEPD